MNAWIGVDPDPQPSRLDILDGVGTRGMNQLEAVRVLSEGSIWSPTPTKRQTYIAPDLPPVDARTHEDMAIIFSLSVCSILIGFGALIGWLVFGVNA